MHHANVACVKPSGHRLATSGHKCPRLSQETGGLVVYCNIARINCHARNVPERQTACNFHGRAENTVKLGVLRRVRTDDPCGMKKGNVPWPKHLAHYATSSQSLI